LLTITDRVDTFECCWRSILICTPSSDMNMRIVATYDLTLRSSANASQSLCHASFLAEIETNRLVARVSALTGNGANPADGECEWVISEGFEDDPTPLAQMPALRPPICDARSPGSA